MSFSLKLFGGLALSGERGPVTGPAAQRHRLALLALLAAAHPGGVSRDKLMGLLWPERETEPARRLLNQAVHALRQAIGADAIRSAGDDLQLDTALVRCDLVAFEAVLAAGDAARAVAIYAGPLLDGFFLADSPEFERWVDRERDRLAAAVGKALEGLAEAAERSEDWSGAVERWRARAAHDPYDSRTALRLMEALGRAGNRAGALQHAAQHQQLLRAELEIEPPPEIAALVERLRLTPAAAAARSPIPGSAAAATVADAPAGVAPVSAPFAPRRRAVWIGATALLLAAVAGGIFQLAARGERSAPAAASPGVDEIAQAVARELARRERGDTSRILPRHRTRSIAAYELYLRGNDPALLRSDSAARMGLEYFRRAVALDSNYAAAWAGLGRMTYRTSGDDPASRTRALAGADSAIRRALALEDSLAEAHALFGVIRSRAQDYATAEWHFRRAVALEPGYARAREWYANFLILTGRPAEALAEAERALAIEPRSATATAEVARALAANDRCDEALARLETLAGLDPPLLRAAGIAVQCYARQERWAEAIATLRPQVKLDTIGSQALLGYVYGRAGRRDEALAIHARLLDFWRRGTIGAYPLAYVPAGLGDRDQAFEWLDRAYEDGSLRFAPGSSLMFGGPPFDALGEDPRLQRLRERFGLPAPPHAQKR